MTSSTSAFPRIELLSWWTLLVLTGAACITLGAKLQIPFWPVPMTMHTLALFLVSALLGPRLGLAAMATYLGAGAMGLPVFSGTPERGIGLAYMAGPTGGYLLGFLLASGLVGWLAAGGGLIKRVLAMLAGLVVIYVPGVAWLANYVPTSDLLAAGVTPFLLGDLIKVAIAATLISGIVRVKRKLK